MQLVRLPQRQRWLRWAALFSVLALAYFSGTLTNVHRGGAALLSSHSAGCAQQTEVEVGWAAPVIAIPLRVVIGDLRRPESLPKAVGVELVACRFLQRAAWCCAGVNQ